MPPQRSVLEAAQPSTLENLLGTNRAQAGTNPADLGTNPPRAGTNPQREPVRQSVVGPVRRVVQEPGVN
jgi:hypothetical protein